MIADQSLFVFGQYRTPDQLAEKARRRLVGLYHGSHIIPHDPVPDQPVTLGIEAGSGAAIDRVHVCYTTDGSTPTVSSPAVAAERIETGWDDLAWSYLDRWQATLPPLPDGARVRYLVVGESGDSGRMIFADSEDGGPVVFGYDVDRERTPAWVRDAVMYEIFVDRFWEPSGRFGRAVTRGDEIYGGNLDGITERLDYLADLGVNVIWLTPIFESETYHGYDALDFSTVAGRLGGDAALCRLVREAHARGIRVLLDFAPNHCSWHHARFLAAQRDEDSPYRDWFTFEHWPDRYLTFGEAKYLPKLNTRNPELVDHLCDVAGRYLSDIGVDGFRLDHALGPPLLFWTQFRERTRRARPDSYTVGEVSMGPGDVQWYQGRLDGCLDFPLLATFRQFFIEHSIDVTAFHSFIAHNDHFYGDDFSRPTFLDNHDMNRFLWAAGNDVKTLKLAATCQFSLKQPPIVYYGTEVGMTQDRDVSQSGFEAARLPMIWENQDRDLLAFYRRLIHVRHKHPALRRGTRRLLSARGGFYAFLCESDGERVLTAINATRQAQTIELPGDRGTELHTGDGVTGTVSIAPMEPALILLA